MTTDVFEGLTKNDLLKPEIKSIPTEFYVFLSFRLAARRKVTMYSSGQSITIPEIQIDGREWTRNGIKEGGSDTAYFLEITGYKENGDEYKFVEVLTVNPSIVLTQAQVDTFPAFYKTDEQIKSLKEKGTAKFSLFNNFYSEQFAAQDDMKEIGMGKQFHVKARKIQYRKDPRMVQGTEEQDTDKNGNPAFWRENYYTQWTRFDTVEKLLVAKKDHWDSDNDSDNLPLSSSFQYPALWESDIQGMTKWFRGELAKPNINLKAITAQANLTATETPDYKEILVNIWQSLPKEDQQHLADVLDKPLPMIDL